MRPSLTFLAVGALLATAAHAATPEPAAGLSVPPGFIAQAIAHVPDARELTIAPNGDLFVGTYERSIYLVPDADINPGPARIFVTVADARQAPAASVVIASGFLFIGAQFGVFRLPYETGDLSPRGEMDRIADLRTSGTARDHVTTTLAVAKGTLYASVGSSCNNCSPDLDATRATIQAMHLDGKDMAPKAVRIRNAIALAVNPTTNALWAGVAGQDELEKGHPYEIFDDVTAHAGTVDYGWPYCYENHKAIGNHDCRMSAVPRVIFPAYETPIGATFYPRNPHGPHAFPAAYRGGAFVTLHGSWHRPLVPPRVAFVPMRGDEPKTAVNWSDPNAQWSEFVGGFQKADGARIARPTGIAVGPDGSLFVSDDQSGTIYRIRPQK